SGTSKPLSVPATNPGGAWPTAWGSNAAAHTSAAIPEAMTESIRMFFFIKIFFWPTYTTWHSMIRLQRLSSAVLVVSAILARPALAADRADKREIIRQARAAYYS